MDTILVDKILALGEKENRKFSNMLQTLTKEAILIRANKLNK